MLAKIFSLSPLAVFFILMGCSAHVQNLATPDGTFNEGQRLMEDEFYEEAREQFVRIKTEFPESSLQAEADLRIADSYYEEESYEVAAKSYEEWVKTYPARDERPYALYRAGKSYVGLMPGNPQRDTRGTEKAINALTRLVIDFPNSEYTDEATKYIEEAQHQLAEKNYRVARFYEKTDEHLAAARRYGIVVDFYADDELAEESMARQVRMLRKAGRNDQADRLAEAFLQKYPTSEYLDYVQP